MALQELFTSRNNHIVDANTYVAQKDRIFFDLESQTFRLSDGVTPGGQIIGGASSGTGDLTISNSDIASESNISISVLSIDGSTINRWSFDREGTLSTPNYAFPLEDGTVDQVIATDGSGNLYWSAQTGGTGGNPLAVKDEGTTITAAATSINFAGAGITATNIGSAVTVTVPKGAGINKIVDVPDVYTGVGLANGQLLVYNYASERWDTKTELSSQNLDGGEF